MPLYIEACLYIISHSLLRVFLVCSPCQFSSTCEMANTHCRLWQGVVQLASLRLHIEPIGSNWPENHGPEATLEQKYQRGRMGPAENVTVNRSRFFSIKNELESR